MTFRSFLPFGERLHVCHALKHNYRGYGFGHGIDHFRPLKTATRVLGAHIYLRLGGFGLEISYGGGRRRDQDRGYNTTYGFFYSAKSAFALCTLDTSSFFTHAAAAYKVALDPMGLPAYFFHTNLESITAHASAPSFHPCGLERSACSLARRSRSCYQSHRRTES